MSGADNESITIPPSSLSDVQDQPDGSVKSGAVPSNGNPAFGEYRCRVFPKAATLGGIAAFIAIVIEIVIIKVAAAIRAGAVF